MCGRLGPPISAAGSSFSTSWDSGDDGAEKMSFGKENILLNRSVGDDGRENAVIDDEGEEGGEYSWCSVDEGDMLSCPGRGEMFERGEGDIAIDGIGVCWNGR